MSFYKERVKDILQGAGLYHRLNSSSIHDIYRRVADKNWIASRDRHLDFYGHLLTGLRRGDLIFDVGANHGLKTDLFLRMGARVIAIDPDETNQSILRERFLSLRLVQKPVTIVGKAVSDRNAVESMLIDGPGSAVNTLSQKWASTLKENKTRHTYGHAGLEFARTRTVESTTLEDLIATYGRPFFIKIDVEGYELNVVRGLRQSVPYLSFEVNLPEFRPEGLECIELLNRLAAEGTFNYATDCERGLMLERWLDLNQFRPVLEQCEESTIEIFWKSSIQ